MTTTKTTLPLYLAATATSLFGNSAIAIVLPWLVLERNGDPAMAGLVAAVSAVPGAIAAFVGGHLIDKIGPRRMSVLSDIGSAVAVAALAIVDAAVGLNVAWFIALGVLGALFDVPGMTARETLLANVSETSGVGLDKIAAWATKAAQRKKDPGLYYCQLPMAELPSWIDVEHFLQTLEPPLPPRRILKIRSKYDELQRMDSPNFYQIAQLLNTELGE